MAETNLHHKGMKNAARQSRNQRTGTGRCKLRIFLSHIFLFEICPGKQHIDNKRIAELANSAIIFRHCVPPKSFSALPGNTMTVPFRDVSGHRSESLQTKFVRSARISRLTLRRKATAVAHRAAHNHRRLPAQGYTGLNDFGCGSAAPSSSFLCVVFPTEKVAYDSFTLHTLGLWFPQGRDGTIPDAVTMQTFYARTNGPALAPGGTSCPFPRQDSLDAIC